MYALAPKYVYRDYFKAKVYTIWVHGPSGRGPGVWLKGRRPSKEEPERDPNLENCPFRV